MQWLRQKRVPVYHGVDATQLSSSFPAILKGGQYPFDRIMFNFPHSGEQRVHINRELLRKFFESCRPHLALSTDNASRVVVVLKKGSPYDSWHIEEQAAASLFELDSRQQFVFEAFPGYGHQTTNPEHNEIEDAICYAYSFKLSSVGLVVAQKETSVTSTEPMAKAKQAKTVKGDRRIKSESKQTAEQRLANSDLSIIKNKLSMGEKVKKSRKGSKQAEAPTVVTDVKDLFVDFNLEDALKLDAEAIENQ
jgi:hypothetical protein